MIKGPHQIQNGLLAVDQKLRVKVPLETIHLHNVFKRLAWSPPTDEPQKATTLT